jgi:hypothetical protein
MRSAKWAYGGYVHPMPLLRVLVGPIYMRAAQVEIWVRYSGSVSLVP